MTTKIGIISKIVKARLMDEVRDWADWIPEKEVFRVTKEVTAELSNAFSFSESEREKLECQAMSGMNIKWRPKS